MWRTSNMSSTWHSTCVTLQGQSSPILHHRGYCDNSTPSRSLIQWCRGPKFHSDDMTVSASKYDDEGHNDVSLGGGRPCSSSNMDSRCFMARICTHYASNTLGICMHYTLNILDICMHYTLNILHICMHYTLNITHLHALRIKHIRHLHALRIKHIRHLYALRIKHIKTSARITHQTN
jgi:hypothetical protein